MSSTFQSLYAKTYLVSHQTFTLANTGSPLLEIIIFALPSSCLRKVEENRGISPRVIGLFFPWDLADEDELLRGGVGESCKCTCNDIDTEFVRFPTDRSEHSFDNV